jgi:hypothetical protein
MLVGKQKTFFVKVGHHFPGKRFNIQDQLKGKVAGCGVVLLYTMVEAKSKS